MNNKSDKKQKRMQKQKQTKNKKKTASHQSKKKKEIKSGGAPFFPSFKGLFSKESNSNKMTQSTQPVLSNEQQKQRLNNTASSASQNPQPLTNPVSSNGSYNSTAKITSNQTNWTNQNKLSQLQPPLLPKSNRFANVQLANLRNPQQNVSEAPANSNNQVSRASENQPPPPVQPNVNPAGFKTIESQSRCSIL